jgi:hypothetical protein
LEVALSRQWESAAWWSGALLLTPLLTVVGEVVESLLEYLISAAGLSDRIPLNGTIVTGLTLSLSLVVFYLFGSVIAQRGAPTRLWMAGAAWIGLVLLGSIALSIWVNEAGNVRQTLVFFFDTAGLLIAETVGVWAGLRWPRRGFRARPVSHPDYPSQSESPRH